MTQLYETRLVAYLDILGWSEACKVESQRLADAATIIHDAATGYSAATKSQMEQLSLKLGGGLNPMYLNVQAGALSDSFVTSMPVGFGFRIVQSASALCMKLLRLGFLTRGGVTIGSVYHRDNVIFGPAVVEAVALEKEANYPRLLCSDSLVDFLSKNDQGHDSLKYVVEDQLGRKIANPFVPIVKIAGRTSRDVHDELWDISGIERKIEEELAKCISAKQNRHAEKWRYMKDVLRLMLQEIDHE